MYECMKKKEKNMTRAFSTEYQWTHGKTTSYFLILCERKISINKPVGFSVQEEHAILNLWDKSSWKTLKNPWKEMCDGKHVNDFS